MKLFRKEVRKAEAEVNRFRQELNSYLYNCNFDALAHMYKIEMLVQAEQKKVLDLLKAMLSVKFNTDRLKEEQFIDLLYDNTESAYYEFLSQLDNKDSEFNKFILSNSTFAFVHLVTKYIQNETDFDVVVKEYLEQANNAYYLNKQNNDKLYLKLNGELEDEQ